MTNYLKDGERLRTDTNGRQFHVKADGTEELVRDGQGVSVPFFMMDSARRTPSAQPFDAKNHKPGFVEDRLAPSQALKAADATARAAHQAMCEAKANGWRNPPSVVGQDQCAQEIERTAPAQVESNARPPQDAAWEAMRQRKSDAWKHTK